MDDGYSFFLYEWIVLLGFGFAPLVSMGLEVSSLEEPPFFRFRGFLLISLVIFMASLL
jgi:hypothetical protein